MSIASLMRLAALSSVVALVSAEAAAQGLEDPIPLPVRESGIAVDLEEIAVDLVAPLWGTNAPGLPDHLFIVDQPGQAWAIDLATNDLVLFLDVSGRLVELGARPQLGLDFDERGFLGLAFHPDFNSSGAQGFGKLYTFTSEPAFEGGDINAKIEPDFTTTPGAQGPFAPFGLVVPNHQSVLAEWQAVDPTDPSAGVDLGSRRELLRIDEPQFNHNSGAIDFLADGTLLIAVGDGGGADDQPEEDMEDFIGVPILGHGEDGNGQNPGNVLGTVLRIDPLGDNSANGQYGVPDDNPFYPGGVGAAGGQAGCEDGFCDEVYAFGFRNLFRLSVDAETGLVIGGDVGQNDIEEVDVIVAGGNYGWNTKEGTFLFDDNGADAGFVSEDSPRSPAGLIDPIAQYDHADDGVSVIGGFVYRGNDIPQLRGRYVFGDFSRPVFDPFNVPCSGRIFHLQTKFGANAKSIADRVERNRFRAPLFAVAGDPLAGQCLLGLGRDAAGNVYALTNDTGTPVGNAGKVLKLVASKTQ